MQPSRPLHLPSIEGLRAVEATARLCSFERAALELNLTASAVSKRVMTLERLLGLSLFVRHANSLSLTEEGAVYVEQAREVLRKLAAMHRHAHAGTLLPLKVTATPTFARQILAPNLRSFAAAHPDVELELIVVAPLLDAPATGADVEIRHGQGLAALSAPLLHDVVTPMASPHYLKASPPVLSLEDIRQLILLRTPFESWKPWLQTAHLPCDEPERGPRFLDLGLAYEAAVNGQGVALCRPSLVGDWLERRALVPLFDIYTKTPGSYYILHKSERHGSDAFVQWLQALCARIAASNLQLAKMCFAEWRAAGDSHAQPPR